MPTKINQISTLPKTYFSYTNLVQKNVKINKTKINSTYRLMSMEQDQIILTGRRIKGAAAMMLAEISEHEDSSSNHETWRKVKRGMENKNLTSDQVKHLIYNAYSSLGATNYREKGKELMKETEFLPFDQISYYITQFSDQDNPSLKKSKSRHGENSSKSRSYSRDERRHNRDCSSRRDKDRNQDSRRSNSNRRDDRSDKRKESTNNNNSNTKEEITFLRKESHGELKYSSVSCNILVDHLRCPKGYYSVPPTKYWPKSAQTRVDIPIHNMQHGRDTCYWKDIYSTPTNPTALIGITPLHKLKPFYMMCGLFKVAKIKPEYRKQITNMLRYEDAREALNQILTDNKCWSVVKYHSRCKQNALQMIRNSRGDWSVTQILLYKEPLFTPKKEPDCKPCFSDRTVPSKHTDNPLSTFTHLDIHVGEHVIHTYTYEDMLILGDAYVGQIIRSWGSRAQEIWERENYPNTEDEAGSTSGRKSRSQVRIKNDNSSKRTRNNSRSRSRVSMINASRGKITGSKDTDTLEGSSKDPQCRAVPGEKDGVINNSRKNAKEKTRKQDDKQNNAKETRRRSQSSESSSSGDSSSSDNNSCSDSDSNANATDTSDSDEVEEIANTLEGKRKEEQAGPAPKITGKKIRRLMKQALLQALAENRLPDIKDSKLTEKEGEQKEDDTRDKDESIKSNSSTRKRKKDKKNKRCKLCRTRQTDLYV